MIDENRDGIRVERLDDIPLLVALLYRMGVATLLDAHYPTHGNWGGDYDLCPLSRRQVSAEELARLVTMPEKHLRNSRVCFRC